MGLRDGAIRGSSYFKLNPVLQWFTGTSGCTTCIISAADPNYNLKRCHDETSYFMM